MKMFGQIELRKIDLPEELQFRIVRQEGWTDMIAALVALLFAFWVAWIWQSIVWMAVFGGIAIAASLVLSRETRISITSSEFVAIGSHGWVFRREMRVPRSEVISVRYDEGYEGQPAGLYVQRTWTHTCILPGIDRKYADVVVEAVGRRFPEMKQGLGHPQSLLFKFKMQSETLKLSEAQQQDPDAAM